MIGTALWRARRVRVVGTPALIRLLRLLRLGLLRLLLLGLLVLQLLLRLLLRLCRWRDEPHTDSNGGAYEQSARSFGHDPPPPVRYWHPPDAVA